MYKIKCIVCGNEYETCNCGSENNTPWKVLCDSSNHYRIHLMLTEYAAKLIDEDEAIAILDKCDISGWNDFTETYRNLIGELLTYKKKKEIENKKIVTDKSYVATARTKEINKK